MLNDSVHNLFYFFLISDLDIHSYSQYNSFECPCWAQNWSNKVLYYLALHKKCNNLSCNVRAINGPLEPHFLGLTEVNIFLLIFDPKHRLCVLVQAVLTCTHNLCFEQKQEKFSTEFFHFLTASENSIYHIGKFSSSYLLTILDDKYSIPLAI